jgi:hypothetical protein
MAPFGHLHTKRPFRPFGHLLADMSVDGNRAALGLFFLLSPLPSSPIFQKTTRTSTALTPTCDCGNVYDGNLL